MSSLAHSYQPAHTLLEFGKLAAVRNRLDRTVLHQFLHAAQIYAPAFDGAMSNHIPMAMHAAWEMGADHTRLQALLEHESPKQTLARAANSAQREAASFAAKRQTQMPEFECSDSWLIHRGNPEAYPWLNHYFSELLAQQSSAQVLTAHLPILLKSPHAFAFHGMIRTAHAIEAGHQAELAAALACWAAFWELLPAAQSKQSQPDMLTITEWGQQLQNLSKTWRSNLPMIVYRMRSAAETPDYAELSNQLRPVASLFERGKQLKALARHAYLHSGNFTVLHMITGLRALGIMLPFLHEQDGQRELIAALDRACVAAWMAGRVVWQDYHKPDTILSWSDLFSAALAQNDEHVIKGIHACWYEFQETPDPEWQLAAQRMLKNSGLA